METDEIHLTMNKASKKIQKKQHSTGGSPTKKKHGNKNFSDDESQVLKQILLDELIPNGPGKTSIEKVIELISNYKMELKPKDGKARKQLPTSCKKTAYIIIKSDYDIAAAYWGPDHEKTKEVWAALNQNSSIQQEVVQDNYTPTSPVMPSYEELLRENQKLKGLVYYYQTTYEPNLTAQSDRSCTNWEESPHQQSVIQNSPPESKVGVPSYESDQTDSYGTSSTENNYTSEEDGPNFDIYFELPSLGQLQGFGFGSRQSSFIFQEPNNYFN